MPVTDPAQLAFNRVLALAVVGVMVMSWLAEIAGPIWLSRLRYLSPGRWMALAGALVLAWFVGSCPVGWVLFRLQAGFGFNITAEAVACGIGAVWLGLLAAALGCLVAAAVYPKDGDSEGRGTAPGGGHGSGVPGPVGQGRLKRWR